MWTNEMPAAPGWYWVAIKGEKPQVCQLVDGVMWTFDCELGMADVYVQNHCKVWSPPVLLPPDAEKSMDPEQQASTSSSDWTSPGTDYDYLRGESDAT